MKSKIIQITIILLVALGAFLAFYVRQPVVESIPLQNHEVIEKPKSEIENIDNVIENPIRVIERLKSVIEIPHSLIEELKIEMENWNGENGKPKSVIKKTGFSSNFTLPIDINNPSHFGIIGESRADDFSDEQMNLAILNQILETLNFREVQAVFFTGNLVSGLEKGSEDSQEPVSDQTLEKHLQQFSTLYESILGKNVPFFPILGDHETVISNAAITFMDHFHLKGTDILGEELLYTVSAGQAFFAVIATNELTEEHKRIKRGFSSPMLKWLEKVLKEASKKYKYLFVMGYEPAYPSSVTLVKAYMPQREAFWKILVDNKVLAYFSSKEHLFDRSNRYGVWQIISGGGGASLNQGGDSQPFFHSLLLTIPGGKGSSLNSPKIQVIDNNGNVVEEFILSSENQALYQKRISRN